MAKFLPATCLLVTTVTLANFKMSRRREVEIRKQSHTRRSEKCFENIDEEAPAKPANGNPTHKLTLFDSTTSTETLRLRRINSISWRVDTWKRNYCEPWRRI
ncbi:predicted protein [Coccidioides posadasii str. Silveira]|uniref:Predicted protein n=1 Tax=Coccidioides posadasii (strain RMSCC 757 / Silveira) TaxID=443226 RepID=E9CYE2_COCPS|nr:predicted protein [Coccidioides posadasii str. Silveira]